jgi:hypothetical protein
VITKYIDVLQPLKAATELLEGRSKPGTFGAIFEIIPVYEHLLKRLKEAAELYQTLITTPTTKLLKVLRD